MNTMAVVGTTNKVNVIDYLLQLAHAGAKVVLFNNLPPFLFYKKREPSIDSPFFVMV
jgi:hypothetical protein